ncbi:universal stress protein [Halobacteria archaeon HArc-gm2]|nr:universal stress protein [Halobacteria archaeon HArc-gm2]
MTRFLVATNSVHVTAAAVDYLEDRLEPGTDEVVVVGVTGPDASDRDVADAANVARARLATSTPTVETREGTVLPELLAAVDEHDPDELIVGPNRGGAGAAGVGSTAQALLAELDRPVVVVPTPALS